MSVGYENHRLFDQSREKIEMQEKISIRFFNDREVRAVWDDKDSRWLFSVLDIVSVLRDEDDYQKTRNYWKYLKAKLKREGNELGNITTQMKLLQATDRINGRILSQFIFGI